MGSIGHETGMRSIVVAGDVTVDWNLARGQGPGRRALGASKQLGGALLLANLVKAAGSDLSDGDHERIPVHAPDPPKGACPTDDHLHHRFASWKRFKEGKGGKQREVWRVDEFLGMERATAKPQEGEPAGSRERADLVVLHDSGLGFREDERLWPRAIADPGEQRPWVLLRMAKPVAEGPLWDRLEMLADRTIVVIHIDDLRLGAVRVTRELSWERTAQDLLSELLGNGQASRLARCAHVVVSFTTAGALVLSPQEKPPCRLIFDPAVMERMWNEKHKGGMIGGVSALTASIARQIVLNPQQPDVGLGVRHGVAALRALDLDGYEECRHGDTVEIEYPVERIAEEVRGQRDPGEESPFAEAPVCDRPPDRDPAPGQGEAPKTWTILEDRHRKEELYDLATRIVKEGHERALPDVPRGEFENLVTFDREEIEGLQSIRTLIRQYDSREGSSHPLSIAVFGPPGSGKTWSVEQVAAGVLPGRVKPIAFNLSQFDDPRELIDALHQVRDISLGGMLPLVLWDEFDTARLAAGGSQDFGWLAHFLAPMQDGKFQDGQLTHPIGRAVFVFAGGRLHRMQKFVEECRGEEPKKAKAPDFLSRLSGYVDVVGPNPRSRNADEEPDGADEDPADEDPYYLVRRAVLLRSVLRRNRKRIFREKDGVQQPDIDGGVLRALLRTREYRHGVRSLTSIITNTDPDRDRLERSDLPSEAQLDLHVDADDFLRLVHETESSSD